MALKAGYKGIKKYIADKLNSLGDLDSLATDAEVAEALAVSLDAVDGAYQLVKDTVGWSRRNLLEPENYPSSTGIFTLNADYTYTVNGSSGASNKQIVIPITGLDGDFYFTGCPSGGSAEKYDLYAWDNTTNARCKKWDGETNSESDFGGTLQEVKLDSSHDIVLTLRVKANVTVSDIVFKPMLIRKDILDTTYEPPHEAVSQQKCDNSVIGPVENGDNASQAYNAGSHFIRNGAFCTLTTDTAQGDALADKFTEGQMGDFILKVCNFSSVTVTAGSYEVKVIPTISGYTAALIIPMVSGTGASAYAVTKVTHISKVPTNAVIANTDSSDHTWHVCAAVLYVKNLLIE